MSKKSLTKHKRTAAENALHRADYHFAPDELENNTVFNTNLRVIPRHPFADTIRQLIDLYADALNAPPLPPGRKLALATGPKRRQASERNMECLIANLVVARANGRRCVSFSQNRNTWADTPLTAGIIDLVKLSEQRGYLALPESGGYYDRVRPWKSRLTRMRGTRDFYKLIATCFTDDPEDSIYSEPDDLIQLRETRREKVRTGKRTSTGKPQTRTRKYKVRIPRSEWQERVTPRTLDNLRVVEMILGWFNDKLASYDIRYTDRKGKAGRLLFPILYAVYAETFSKGGRFYTGRRGHQALKKSERATITIDGQPTVELDFGGMHVRMIYHLLGYEYPLNRDPYTAVLEAIGLHVATGRNGKPTDPKVRELRDDLKIMLLALVNGTGTFPQARARAYRRLFRAHHDKKQVEAREEAEKECQERFERWKSVGLFGGGKPDVERALKAFHEAHAKIRDSFHTGIGLDLQRIDSDIARGVCFEMMLVGKGVACLPVHDSFIVPASSRKRLRHAMRAIYRVMMMVQTGRESTFKIPVE